MLTLDAINHEIDNIISHGTNRADIACLADLYVCRSAMQGKTVSDEIVEADGSEFAVCINGKCFSDILPFLEELLEAVKVVHPRLYEAFMRNLRQT